MTPNRRRTRYAALPFDHGQPIAQPNFTPAAILFSVLAVLFLGFQRPSTHALVIALPVSSGLGDGPEEWPDDIVVHQIVPTPANEILWNGEPIDTTELVRRLRAAKSTVPRPGIVYAPHADASYDLSAKVLSILYAAGVTGQRFCLGGLAQHREFSPGPPQYRLALSIYIPERLNDRLASGAVPDCGKPSPAPLVEQTRPD